MNFLSPASASRGDAANPAHPWWPSSTTEHQGLLSPLKAGVRREQAGGPPV
jgi:hypothetical protein